MSPNLRAVPEGGTTYDELVKRGREARARIDDYQWTQGDLALEVEQLPMSERPRDPKTGALVTVGDHALKRWADDIDVPYNTVRAYRWTAEVWPRHERRDGVPWITHFRLNGQDDRFALIRPGMTGAEAAALVRARTAASPRRPGWFELAGIVGDDLIAAQKHMGTFEAAITRQPNKDLRAKLERYAGIAREVADRLDAVREWRVEDVA